MEFQRKQDYRCTFCDYTCAYKSILESHMIVHTREKPFLCHKCNRRFGFKQLLNTHILRVHQGLSIERNKKYKCSLCPYVTHNKSHFKYHIPVHTGERSFPCQYQNCGYAAKSPVPLRMHIAYKHKNERRFLCQVPNCSYRANSKADMTKHLVKHSDCRAFVCEFEGCSYRSKSEGVLKKHKSTVHGGGYKHKPFLCSMCSYRSTSKSLLKRHQFAHTEEKPIKCSFSGCTYFCKTKWLLNAHIENRHTERAFKCDIEGCLSTAPSRWKLESHKKNVHSDKVYKCPHCDFRAKTSWALTPHIERHNTSQRIQCPKEGCTFQARHSESLTRHKQRHQENLICLVEGCVYAGVSRSAWKRHMELHDPTGRPFHCPLCPKHFSSNGCLSKHLDSHTKEKPFKCPSCDYSSASKQTIKKHVRVIHSAPFSKLNEESICDHCNVNFGSAIGLAMHRLKLKTAVVMLTRLQLKQGTPSTN